MTVQPIRPDRAAMRAPHDLAAERAVLGHLLIHPAAVDQIAQLVTAGDFYRPGHALVFDAIIDLRARGEGTDPVLVAAELARAGAGHQAPDLVELVGLASDAPPSAAGHARVVAEQAARRRLAAAATELVDAALDPAGDVLDLVDAAETSLLDVARPLRARIRPSRAVTAAAFVLDAPTELEPVWGDPGSVLWAAGEALLVVAPQGTGKTTIAGQLALALAGVRPAVLGYPVRPARRVLYVAADRPSQIRRSMARMVTEADRDALEDRLIVWPGPVPADFGTDDQALVKLAVDHGADTVIVDSLKDVAVDLARDETGSRVNRCVQTALAAGVDVALLHHQRKAQAGAGKPKALDDVYGSTWLTSGAGSVLLLWGEPGDAVVELTHLKQPAEPVGPLTLVHDHLTGTTTVEDRVDPLAVLAGAQRGLSAVLLAAAVTGEPDPGRNEIERARRTLDRLAQQGLATCRRGTPGRGGESSLWFPIEAVGG